MTTYGDELTITQINERFNNEKPFQDEIYDEAFFKHPYLQNRTSVKPWILLKAIYDLCISGSYFDNMVYPTDIIVEDYNIDTSFNHIYNFDVRICGQMYEFMVDTTEGMKENCMEYATENLSYFNRSMLFESIKHTEQVKEIYHIESEESEEQEKQEPEIKYENESCPVCFCEYTTGVEEDLTNDKEMECFGVCGHKLCEPCYETITCSNNSRCPVCREVWDDITDDTSSRDTEILWNQEDIDVLCEEEDNDTLNRIIAVDELVEAIIRYDGYENILGYDTSVEVGGLTGTPDRYRELTGGGYEYVVMCISH